MTRARPVPHRARRIRGGRRRGTALVAALACSLTIAAIAIAMATVSAANHRDNEATRHRVERKLIAEAGLSTAFANLVAGGDGNVASDVTPLEWGPGTCHVACVANGDGTLTLTSTGTIGTSSRTLRAVLRERIRNPFFGAVFAGNAAKDPSYTLTLGGTTPRHDRVKGGDVYSGGSVVLENDAKVDGTIQAAGTITGATGVEGVTEPAPLPVGPHFEAVHDVDVKAAFAANGTYESDSLGGSAYQVPEDDPAHIFRLNPSDRTTETSGTDKDDYFLEDPYEDVESDDSTNPNRATRITLSGVSGAPGPSGTGKVYFVDGNLWIHNKRLYSFVFHHGNDAGVQVTIVVKGNIYVTDNIVLKNTEKDGLALIAVKDGAVEDSGNIYFGDADFGKLEQMDAFMYAEGDFYDTNIGTSDASTLEVNGIISAANHVTINHGTGSDRTKLKLNFDSRFRDQTLDLPGLAATQFSNRRRTYEWLAEFEVGSAP